MSEPVVSNAADEGQVAAASIKEKIGRDREIDDLKKVLQTEHGRRFVWRLLVRAKTFQTIWEPSAKIHFNAGQQDFGFFILAEVEEVDPQFLVQMMIEAKSDKEKRPNQKKEK